MCCPSCTPSSRASAGLYGLSLSEYTDICRPVREARTAVCVCVCLFAHCVVRAFPDWPINYDGLLMHV